MSGLAAAFADWVDVAFFFGEVLLNFDKTYARYVFKSVWGNLITCTISAGLWFLTNLLETQHNESVDPTDKCSQPLPDVPVWIFQFYSALFTTGVGFFYLFMNPLEVVTGKFNVKIGVRDARNQKRGVCCGVCRGRWHEFGYFYEISFGHEVVQAIIEGTVYYFQTKYVKDCGAKWYQILLLSLLWLNLAFTVWHIIIHYRLLGYWLKSCNHRLWCTCRWFVDLWTQLGLTLSFGVVGLILTFPLVFLFLALFLYEFVRKPFKLCCSSCQKPTKFGQGEFKTPFSLWNKVLLGPQYSTTTTELKPVPSAQDQSQQPVPQPVPDPGVQYNLPQQPVPQSVPNSGMAYQQAYVDVPYGYPGPAGYPQHQPADPNVPQQV